MADVHPFHADMEALGFRVMQEGRRGVVQYALSATRYLTYWVHWDAADSSALFTWELDIGQFMHDHGLQIGTNETLNLFLFPQNDARGAADVTFVAQELDRVESILGAIKLTDEG
ncbi:MAG: hypothetical protein ABR548_14300 [Actinomycetota bacterium]|nr:hypothetical protein [Actinomycetota bacterium]